ncbi:MAG TPA: hypothetical protein DCQ28_07640 [Bacteroidetes bacterium]|nr:hypothetical protein [Bacteroidota bacterium]
MSGRKLNSFLKHRWHHQINVIEDSVEEKLFSLWDNRSVLGEILLTYSLKVQNFDEEFRYSHLFVSLKQFNLWQDVHFFRIFTL